MPGLIRCMWQMRASAARYDLATGRGRAELAATRPRSPRCGRPAKAADDPDRHPPSASTGMAQLSGRRSVNMYSTRVAGSHPAAVASPGSPAAGTPVPPVIGGAASGMVGGWRRSQILRSGKGHGPIPNPGKWHLTPARFPNIPVANYMRMIR